MNFDLNNRDQEVDIDQSQQQPKRLSAYDMSSLEKELYTMNSHKQIKTEDSRQLNMFQDEDSDDDDIIFAKPQIRQSNQLKIPVKIVPRQPAEFDEKCIQTGMIQCEKNYSIDYFYILSGNQVNGFKDENSLKKIDRLLEHVTLSNVKKVLYRNADKEYGNINIDLPYGIINHVNTFLDNDQEAILYEVQWFPRKERILQCTYFEKSQLIQSYPRILLAYIKSCGLLFLKN